MNIAVLSTNVNNELNYRSPGQMSFLREVFSPFKPLYTACNTIMLSCEVLTSQNLIDVKSFIKIKNKIVIKSHFALGFKVSHAKEMMITGHKGNTGQLLNSRVLGVLQ